MSDDKSFLLILILFNFIKRGWVCTYRPDNTLGSEIADSIPHEQYPPKYLAAVQNDCYQSSECFKILFDG
jgi:hypothetical protein